MCGLFSIFPLNILTLDVVPEKENNHGNTQGCHVIWVYVFSFYTFPVKLAFFNASFPTSFIAFTAHPSDFRWVNILSLRIYIKLKHFTNRSMILQFYSPILTCLISTWNTNKSKRLPISKRHNLGRSHLLKPFFNCFR